MFRYIMSAQHDLKADLKMHRDLFDAILPGFEDMVDKSDRRAQKVQLPEQIELINDVKDLKK